MKISYKRLWLMLVEKDMSGAALGKELKLSAGTLTKLNKGEEAALFILLRICDYFNCDIGDICEAVPVPIEGEKNSGQVKIRHGGKIDATKK